MGVLNILSPKVSCLSCGHHIWSQRGGREVCELLKTLPHQVHGHQVRIRQGVGGLCCLWSFEPCFFSQLPGKWLLAGVPSRLKCPSLIRTEQEIIDFEGLPGKNLWKAKENLQGGLGVTLR